MGDSNYYVSFDSRLLLVKITIESNQHAQEFLQRHQRGNWGELDEHDRQENELSVLEGFRILSAYRTAKDARLWIITEADRSSTTILLPEEY